MNLLASEQGDWVCELETKATGGGARIVKATPVFPRVLDAACDLLERVAERLCDARRMGAPGEVARD
jgi:hypothetical protein